MLVVWCKFLEHSIAAKSIAFLGSSCWLVVSGPTHYKKYRNISHNDYKVFFMHTKHFSCKFVYKSYASFL